MIAPNPKNEAKRVEILKNLEILDTKSDQNYDLITKLAANIMDTPVAYISFLDEDRQWFKSMVGYSVEAVPRAGSLCSFAILEPDTTMIVHDATKDHRFADNPMVIMENGIRFYAGAPIVVDGDKAIGTICAIDVKSRPDPSPKQLESLKELSILIVNQLELRKSILEVNEQVERLNKNHDNITDLNERCSTILEKIKARKKQN